MNSRTITHASVFAITAAITLAAPALAARDNGNGYQGSPSSSLRARDGGNGNEGNTATSLRNMGARPDRGTDLGTVETQPHKRPVRANQAGDVAGTAASLSDLLFAAWYRWAVAP